MSYFSCSSRSRTGLAYLHQGEAVIPANRNTAAAGAGGMTFNISISMAGGGAPDALAEQVTRAIENNLRGAGDRLRKIIMGKG